MQSAYAERFAREMACTPAEWLRTLPAAVGALPWRLGDAQATIDLRPGTLAIEWREGEPRVIALVRMPRLLVDFRFDAVDAQRRLAFMKRFDLYMQRGGG